MSQHGQAEMPDNVFQTTPAVKVTAKFILELETVLCYCGLGCEQWGDFCPHLTYCHNLFFSYMLIAGQDKYVFSGLQTGVQLWACHPSHQEAVTHKCQAKTMLAWATADWHGWGSLPDSPVFSKLLSTKVSTACLLSGKLQAGLAVLSLLLGVCCLLIIYRRYQDLGA